MQVGWCATVQDLAGTAGSTCLPVTLLSAPPPLPAALAGAGDDKWLAFDLRLEEVRALVGWCVSFSLVPQMHIPLAAVRTALAFPAASAFNRM